MDGSDKIPDRPLKWLQLKCMCGFLVWMWTCNCKSGKYHYSINDIIDETCERCNTSRPPLEGREDAHGKPTG